MIVICASISPAALAQNSSLHEGPDQAGPIKEVPAMPTRSTMLTKVRLKFEGHGAVVGLALECWRGNKGPLFEIFRNDETLRFEVTLFVQDVPLELLEYAVPIARERLGDFVPYP